MWTKNSKRWDASRYGPTWEARSLACRERDNFTCQICKRKGGDTYISKSGKVRILSVAACHVNPCEEDREDAELWTLCFGCHARYDCRYKAAMRWARVEILKHRIARENYDIALQEAIKKIMSKPCKKHKTSKNVLVGA